MKLTAAIAIYHDLKIDKIKTESVIFQDLTFSKFMWWKFYDFNNYS